MKRVEIVESPDTGCWVWQGCLASNGYPVYRSNLRAHRVYYEELVGPIPAGHELHHLCLNPACVNPGHVEPLTHAEHAARHRKTHCKRGHPLSGDNIHRKSDGTRACRECMRAYDREYKRRQDGYYDRNPDASPGPRPTTSRHRGVSWETRSGKWRAEVKFKRARFYTREYGLGLFDSEQEAAEAIVRFWQRFGEKLAA